MLASTQTLFELMFSLIPQFTNHRFCIKGLAGPTMYFIPQNRGLFQEIQLSLSFRHNVRRISYATSNLFHTSLTRLSHQICRINRRIPPDCQLVSKADGRFEEIPFAYSLIRSNGCLPAIASQVSPL